MTASAARTTPGKSDGGDPVFPLPLLFLLLGGGAVAVAAQSRRGRKRGAGVPPATLRDPFEGYDQWTGGDGRDAAPIRQSPAREATPSAREPAPTRVRVLSPPRTAPEATHDPGPRNPRRVGPAAPAPRPSLPAEREVNDLPDEVLLDEDGLSDDFNARWARVSRGS